MTSRKDDLQSARPRVMRGLVISVALALIFLVGSAVQSAASLAARLAGNDVMKAASGAAWSGPLARQIAVFIFALVALHLLLALVVWATALATSVFSSVARDKFGRIVVLWFCLLAGATIVFNAYWFPRSGLGSYYHGALSARIGPVGLGPLIYGAIVSAAALVLVAALCVTLLRNRHVREYRRTLAMAALVPIAVGISLLVARQSDAGAGTDHLSDRPHVIMLGIDSLRLGELRRFGGRGATPNLDAFLDGADVVADTTTPVARTFPSWSAILTGRGPRTTGARYNLAPWELIRMTPTVADVLRRNGYRTIYSTDEVRFANIDQAFGFDQVVTPAIGAADFLIGTYNELPLASVVINARFGETLFPFSHGNRGVATMFQPETFLARLDREVHFDAGPTFFISHLTASHWPYYVSDSEEIDLDTIGPGERPQYMDGLRTVDEMFGDLVAMLERKGALRNAVVVILSDHGEALYLPSDSMLTSDSRMEGMRVPLTVVNSGHGQSVLSPVQYQVLLGFRSFGPNGGFESSGRMFPGGATVEDIAPTLLDLLGIPLTQLSPTGMSLAPALRARGTSVPASPAGRVRFTETDLKVLPDAKGGVDEEGTARQNSVFFDVDPVTARLRVRAKYIPLVLSFKERAAFNEDLLLAALPVGPDAHTYLLIDKHTTHGRLLMGPPDEADVEGRRLWNALTAEYGEELKPAISITSDDLPEVDRAWTNFFQSRSLPAGPG